jgi:hypothetical protein
MHIDKRGLGESHRTEAQVRQEMAVQVRQEVAIQVRQELATQHDQALKENENLLKEKETRIQVSTGSQELLCQNIYHSCGWSFATRCLREHSKGSERI